MSDPAQNPSNRSPSKTGPEQTSEAPADHPSAQALAEEQRRQAAGDGAGMEPGAGEPQDATAADSAGMQSMTGATPRSAPADSAGTQSVARAPASGASANGVGIQPMAGAPESRSPADSVGTQPMTDDPASGASADSAGMQPMVGHQLIARINRGDYRTVFDGTNALGAFGRGTLGLCSFGLVIAFLAVLVAAVTSHLPLLWQHWQFALLMWLVILTMIVTARSALRSVLTTVADHVAPALISPDHAEDMAHQLAFAYAPRRQVWFALVFSGLLSPILVRYQDAQSDLWLSGIAVLFTAFLLVGAVALSFVMPLLRLLTSLGGYHYRLYRAAPAHSRLVVEVSRTTGHVVYMLAVVFALVTLLMTIQNPFAMGVEPVFVATSVWFPLLTLFISAHYSLGRIIHNGKWAQLTAVQEQIHRLQASQPVLDKDTLEHVDKLIDYHERLRNTRSSAISFRSGLSLMHSLVLPVIAALLGNIDKLFKLVDNVLKTVE